jgi:hypothetical protein
MPHRLINDVRAAAALAARRTFFVGAVAVSLFMTTLFLAAAAFVATFDRYGPIEACLACAAIFFIVAVLCAVSYFGLKKTIEHKIETDVKETARSIMPDPATLAVGLQLARALGLRRLIPVVALGGLAAMFVLGRGSSSADDPADTDAG